MVSGLARRPALLAAVLLALSAPEASASEPPQRFSAERLVRMEGLGPARLSPSGRWAVVERRGPYASAATYAYGPLTGALLADLIVADAWGGTADRILGGGDPDGYQAGPFSPDERRMVVYRLTADRRELGVLTLASGEIRWLGVAPELAVLGRTVAWRDDRALVAVLTGDDALPLYYRLARQTQAAVSERWTRAAEGRRATATFVVSGQGRDRRAHAAPARLALIDVDRATTRTLAEADVFDLEIAPGGRTVAAVVNAEDLQPAPGDVLAVGTPTRRRRLMLVDLHTGGRSDPLPGRDLLSHLLAWSPDGEAVLVYGRRPGEAWSDGALLRVAADGSATRPVDLGDARPVVLAAGGERIPAVRAGWGNGRAGALVGQGPDAWRFEGGPRTDRPPPSCADDSHGGARGRWEVRSVGVSGSACLSESDDAERATRPLEAGERIAAAAGPVRLVARLAPSGVETMTLETAGGRRTLAAVNTDLSALAWGDVREIRHPGPDGAVLSSWLLSPPGPPPAAGWPTVVLIYPGQRHADVPAMLRPGSARTQLSPLVLASAGYAVMVPSLPLTAEDGPAPPDLAARVLAALDAAVAAAPLDRSRTALMGHSFGGHGALVAAAQTNRFQAVVASAGLADYGTAMRDTLHFSSSPEDGVLIAGRIGYFETGQGAMGALPWTAPARYVAASPLYQADRIEAPVLLIHGDLDPVAAEAMFGALYRLNREAGLLTYWGEGHNLASPANIVDLHRRVVAWLDERLSPGEARVPAADPQFDGHADQDGVVGARP